MWRIVSRSNRKSNSKRTDGIALTNNEIKDFMKIIKSLENRKISLKGATAKIISQ